MINKLIRFKLGKKKKKRYAPLVGLEPTTFELEVQHASPLRHRGCGEFVR